MQLQNILGKHQKFGAENCEKCLHHVQAQSPSSFYSLPSLNALRDTRARGGILWQACWAGALSGPHHHGDNGEGSTRGDWSTQLALFLEEAPLWLLQNECFNLQADHECNSSWLSPQAHQHRFPVSTLWKALHLCVTKFIPKSPPSISGVL